MTGADIEETFEASVPVLKETYTETTSNAPAKRPTISEKLVRLGEAAELFHEEDCTPFASVILKGGHSATWPLNYKDFRLWLEREYWCKYGQVPSSQAMQDALRVLAAMAIHDGQEHQVFVRVAGTDDAVYIDLVNDAWEAVEITADGWQVIANPPVKFRRAKGMKPLPHPERGGSIDELREFVNIKNEVNFILFSGYIIGALNANGPYPVLVINGEQGSAKTSAQRVACKLIDPGRPDLRSAPRNEQDFVIGARNKWALGFDNLSHIQPWFSDAICRLATGSGFATRTLYENDEETTFEATRPQLLNGIGDIANRGDLLSRALVITLPSISASSRKSESTFWQSFEVARPRILGALYDAVSCAIRDLPNVHLDALPRMADFVKWVTAAEPALGWVKHTFVDACNYNRKQANELALEASPLTPFVFQVAKSDWQGSPSELLVKLNELAPDSQKHLKAWPKSAKALTNELDRLAPDLRATGINAERGRNMHGRFWTIERLKE
ncbi:MAG: hypothetical protein M0Z32_00160 [Actinomycetota bacterium]|nr:hypothetical protein [Actinomycetota bacterium]MCL6093570.1 hypothetical protein [Actinomycetota bacterium]MDA8166162.1 hypothetical protein [Actinomycetota bacterium]